MLRTRCQAAAMAVLLVLPRASAAQSTPEAIARSYADAAGRLIGAALADSAAYERLSYMTDRFGHRFSGTQSLERAIDWMLEEMRADGLENVRGEPVMVPRWVRGHESARMVEPRPQDLPMLGLGGSVGTPPEGITAEVLVVSSFGELSARAAEAAGRIVLYDVPFTTYGETVAYRVRGAIEAARVGAVASLIRSVGPYGMKTPHTGGMSYEDGIPRIPHAALTMEDAMMLARMQERGERPVVQIQMEASTLPDVMSRNVVAELVGRERPEEIVVLGGHIDSWDVGQGAMDDAGGVVAAWEAVRLMKALGLQPRRTVRVVAWTNEENGLRGARAYAEEHAAEVDDHVLAIESDNGAFMPSGVSFTGSPEATAIIAAIARLLAPIDATIVAPDGGGADIGPLMERGVPGMAPLVDGSRYFWYHHTDADTVDKLDPDEVARVTAVMAVMAFVVADLEETLPRAAPAGGR